MDTKSKPTLFGSFFGYFIAHSTIANLVLVLILVLGLFSINKLRSQFFPDVINETIYVSVSWPGAGAEDLDSGVVGFLEPSLLELEGVEKVVSRSYEGVSRIKIDFISNWNMEKALDDVKIAVEETQNLPDEIRSTLSLREYDGLSYEEIAKVQNCPIGTVRSRIFKGRELINETFSKLGLSKTWSN